jgi:hypothetical protein
MNNYLTSVEKADIGLYSKTVAHDPGMVDFGTAAGERIVGWDALREAIEA